MTALPPTVEPAVYQAWVKAEELPPHSVGALTAAQVLSKLTPEIASKTKPHVAAILAYRQQILEEQTVYGPLSLLNKPQWDQLLMGPGLEGPTGPHTNIAFSQETVLEVSKTVLFPTLPSLPQSSIPMNVTEEGLACLPPNAKSSSLFLYGDDPVLLPRLPSYQLHHVYNPFLHTGAQPLAPPISFMPSSTRITVPSQSAPPPLPPRPGEALAQASINAAYGISSNAQGSAGKDDRCPAEIQGYCRSWNVHHQTICKYSHLFWSEGNDPTGLSTKSKWTTKRWPPGSAEFDYVQKRFLSSWVHGSSKPTVTSITQVSCPQLDALFQKREQYLTSMGIKPNITELYHGTCEANFTTLFTQGFQPPADYGPHPQCSVSGKYAGKVSTSLCKRTCRLCVSTSRHNWSMCHMWGLGIYFAIDSSKSDIYVSDKKGSKTSKTGRKLLVCSVMLGDAETVKQLKRANDMHDRVAPVSGKHSLFAHGFKSSSIPTDRDGHTLGVMHDEYIVFHPHQIVPLYIIEYDKK